MERVGDTPLTVGGLGRGALTTRYSLVRMEMQRIDPETAIYFSYNGSAPSTDEAAELDRLGGWPYRPLKSKAVSGEFKDELNDDDFEENKGGRPGLGRRADHPGVGLLDHRQAEVARHDRPRDRQGRGCPR